MRRMVLGGSGSRFSPSPMAPNPAGSGANTPIFGLRAVFCLMPSRGAPPCTQEEQAPNRSPTAWATTRRRQVPVERLVLQGPTWSLPLRHREGPHAPARAGERGRARIHGAGRRVRACVRPAWAASWVSLTAKGACASAAPDAHTGRQEYQRCMTSAHISRLRHDGPPPADHDWPHATTGPDDWPPPAGRQLLHAYNCAPLNARLALAPLLVTCNWLPKVGRSPRPPTIVWGGHWPAPPPAGRRLLAAYSWPPLLAACCWPPTTDPLPTNGRLLLAADS